MSYYVLVSAPSKEVEALRILQREGHEITVPIQRNWKQGGGGRRRLQEIALTPRYLFLKRTDNDFPIYSIRQLNCRQGKAIVTGYLKRLGGTDGEPYILPQPLVEYLESLAPQAATAGYLRSFKEGDTVRTPQGFIGRMIGSSKERAKVLVEALGKIHVVTVSVHSLEAA